VADVFKACADAVGAFEVDEGASLRCHHLIDSRNALKAKGRGQPPGPVQTEKG